jgi:D-alanyl-D-alanine carboxypeptidase (penicillin-binding protein 5/6)
MPSPAMQAIVPRAPDIAASSYILIDAVTGHAIMEMNSDEALPPASLTKIMTAYVAEYEIDNGNLSLDDQVFISERAWRTQGSKTFVDVNSYVRVEDLLRGIIIQSGNDASVALAEAIGGSEEVFAQMMNREAKRLGLVNTNFTNATGLTGPQLYSTAQDLSLLVVALIRDFPEHYALYSQKEFRYNNISQANRNRLLRSLLKRARVGDLGWSEPEVAKLWKELCPRR